MPLVHKFGPMFFLSQVSVLPEVTDGRADSLTDSRIYPDDTMGQSFQFLVYEVSQGALAHKVLDVDWLGLVW